MSTPSRIILIPKVRDSGGGGGSGATNLAYTASPTGGTVTSDTGTDATVPLSDGTNAGLLSPAQHAALAALATTYQPLDSDLTAIAALSTTSFGRGLLTLADAAALRSTVGSATDTTTGVVELATTAEVTTGTDTVRAATPAGVKAAVDAAIAALIASAPGVLDTLDELAAALGDDPNFAATITTALAGKQPIDSDLTAIAALTTTTYGRAFLTLADQAALMALVPAASDTVQGKVELATTAETTTGTDATRAVTPAGLLNATTASNINARIGVEKAGTLIGTRRRINFIDGSGITTTVTDDPANEEVDVTIAASGGGASTGAGTWLTPASAYVPTVPAIGSNVYGGDEVHFIPLLLDANATADRIGVWVQSAASAGKTVRLGIYNTANGRPTTVLLDAGTVAVDSTGGKEITISQALTGGVLYALAVHFEQVGSPFTGLYTFGNQTTANALTDYLNRSAMVGQAFGSGLPSNPTLSSNGKPPPLIRVRLT